MPREPISRDQQIRNLGSVGGRKLAKLMDMARKQGQIRALIYTKKNLNREIEKEYRDLNIIIEDLVELGVHLED